MSAVAPPEVAAAPLLRPWWRRARLWAVLAVAALAGAALVSTLADRPGRPLDPASAHRNGSRALARLLDGYGVTLRSTAEVSTALDTGRDAAVVVTAPDEYSGSQLRRLAAAAGRLVLVQPGTRAARAVSPGLQPQLTGGGVVSPDCSDRGAAAAGPVRFPDGSTGYLPGGSGATSCYAGGALTATRLAVLGSPGLLQNDHLADEGVAALDVNLITDSRRLDTVVWLLPGRDAGGSGSASVWELFPTWWYRAFWTLIALGALVALWRARRLGGVVVEPLPVVVRSSEVVEGHGRLYARAGARDRAAAALRAATVARLAHRLGLPRGAGAEQVATAAAPLAGRAPAEVGGLLAGPAPADDAELVRLARELDALEKALGSTPTEGRHT